jgi:hypothetical protein
MYFDATVASHIHRLGEKRLERKAALNWRTRHMKSKESQVLTAVVTNVLELFTR